MSIIFLVFVIGLVALVVMLYRRRKNPARLMWSEIGTIVDRSLRAYRRHLVPLLALSAICAPLGGVTYTSFSSFLVELLGLSSTFVGDDWIYSAVRLVTLVVLVMGSLGLGKTLLACGVAQALHDEALGQPVSLGRMLGQQRWRATIELMLRMIVPSLINAFLNLLGLLLTLSWRVAPTALIFERLSPREAVKHGRALVKPVRGQLADVLVPLWLIGWLIAGVPTLGSLWVISTFVTISPSAFEALTLLGTIASSVFVAPLTALGASHFYMFVRDRSTQRMEATIEELYGDRAALSQSASPATGADIV